MSQLSDLLAKLKITDEDYVERLMKDCKRRDEEVIEKIKESNDFTRKKAHAVPWTEMLLTQRRKISSQLLEQFAKERRDKNQANIQRLSKNPKFSKEHIEKLKKSFEENAVADIEVERARLEEQDTKATADMRVLDKQLEVHREHERSLLARLGKTMEESEKMLRETIEKVDAEFYRGLVDELTKEPDGPASSFSVPKFQMLVAARDNKREQDIAAWHAQRDKEFLKIRTHVDTDNAKLLS